MKQRHSHKKISSLPISQLHLRIHIFFKTNCQLNGVKINILEDATERRRDIFKIIFSRSIIKAQTKKKSNENYTGISNLRANLISSLNRQFVTSGNKHKVNTRLSSGKTCVEARENKTQYGANYMSYLLIMKLSD